MDEDAASEKMLSSRHKLPLLTTATSATSFYVADSVARTGIGCCVRATCALVESRFTRSAACRHRDSTRDSHAGSLYRHTVAAYMVQHLWRQWRTAVWHAVHRYPTLEGR